MAFPLTAPLLDFLVLSVITESDAYGYQITQIVKRAAPMKDSALYPVLRGRGLCIHGKLLYVPGHGVF